MSVPTNITMTSGEPYYVGRISEKQYGFYGTGTAVFAGAFLAAGPWENLVTIAAPGATTLETQLSHDVFPYIRATVTGSGQAFLAGCEVAV